MKGEAREEERDKGRRTSVGLQCSISSARSWDLLCYSSHDLEQAACVGNLYSIQNQMHFYCEQECGAESLFFFLSFFLSIHESPGYR